MLTASGTELTDSGNMLCDSVLICTSNSSRPQSLSLGPNGCRHVCSAGSVAVPVVHRARSSNGTDARISQTNYRRRPVLSLLYILGPACRDRRGHYPLPHLKADPRRVRSRSSSTSSKSSQPGSTGTFAMGTFASRACRAKAFTSREERARPL